MESRSSDSVRVFYPKFDTQGLVEVIKRKVPGLNRLLPLKLVVLFGSYARGNYTVASDIDLLVIYKGRSRQDVYAKVREAIDIPQLEPHVYTEAEYSKQEKVIEPMLKGGKVIYEESESVSVRKINKGLYC